MGVSILLSLPALMVYLSIALPEKLSRIANLVLGLIFTLIMLIFLISARVWLYYKYFAAVEVALTGSAVWLAWRWPKNQFAAHRSAGDA